MRRDWIDRGFSSSPTPQLEQKLRGDLLHKTMRGIDKVDLQRFFQSTGDHRFEVRRERFEKEPEAVGEWQVYGKSCQKW